MTNDEAEKLARELRPEDVDEGLNYDALRCLCDFILSGDYKREIENAAFERASSHIWNEIAPSSNAESVARCCNAIRALITPAKTAEALKAREAAR